jgi:hypothetical protein
MSAPWEIEIGVLNHKKQTIIMHKNSLVNHFRVFNNAVSTIGEPIESHDRGCKDSFQVSLLGPGCKGTGRSFTMLCQTLTKEGYIRVGRILLVRSSTMCKVGRTLFSITI